MPSPFDRPMIIPAGGIQNAARFAPTIPAEPSDDAIRHSYLGTPIYANLIFEADEDTPENAPLVLDTVLMEVNIPKNVVLTPISGRDGTVKEYINRSDYEITIHGIIVSPYANVFPKEEVTALRNLLDLPKALAVSSSFLQIFSVHSIVVMFARVGERMGSRNEVPFTINALEDKPIELREI